MKDLKDYREYHYKMVMRYDQDEQVYFIEFPELPGCIAEGPIPEKAVKNALKVKDEWLKTALDAGWDLPKPTAQAQVSGRTTLRLPKYVHQKLLKTAEAEGVSLNQLVLTYIAEGLERTSARDYLAKVMKKKGTGTFSERQKNYRERK
ncbi:MAG: toxin-antitoxin system HicB family antitoxin [Nitrospirota bacterium]